MRAATRCSARRQVRRAILPFAIAAAIAACSSTAERSSPAAAPGTAPAAATPVAPLPKSLKVAMQGIEEDWKRIEAGLAANPVTDLAAIAGAAQRVAAVMKLAYDPWDDAEVPDFGKFAREAEAAFHDLAAKAAAGDAAAVKALQPTLQPQHCARCHDAYEAVKG
jgi:hypothetical protein